MSEPGDRIGDRYRELAREAPPPALDGAILAASRRAVGAGPAGAKPSASRRWFVPASVAAVLVLGVGVALRMQVEQPGVETSLPSSEYPVPSSEYPVPSSEYPVPSADVPAAPVAKAEPMAKPASPAEPPPRALAKERAAPPAREASRPAPTIDLAPLQERAFVPEPPKAPMAQTDSSAAAAPQDGPAAAARAPGPQSIAPSMAAPPPAQGAALRSAPLERREAAADAALTPAAELERIARLREAGRNEEADRALAAFHRRFPDHPIPTGMWERVKPR